METPPRNARFQQAAAGLARLTEGPATELIGLGVVGILLLSLIGMLLTTLSALESVSRSQEREIGAGLASAAAAAISRAAPEQHDAALQQWASQLAPAGWVQTVRWDDARGTRRVDWRAPAQTLSVELGAPTPHVAAVTIDSAPAGKVVLELALPSGSAPPWLWASAMAVVGVAMLSFLGFYRMLRRRLAALVAIQRNLRDYASGVETDLAGLGLSDALGQTARAWNQLIELVKQAQGQPQRTAADGAESRALQKLEARSLRMSLDRLPIGVLRVSPDGVIRYANATAGHLLGDSAARLVTQPLVTAVGSGAVEPLLAALPRPGAVNAVDHVFGDGDQQRVLRFQLAPGGDNAEPERLLTLQDVTHLQEVERARDKFLYHVTHELRTPLTNIHAYAETLTKPDFDDEQTRRECYNVIVSETRRLNRLVEDILSISQLEVGTARMDRGEVDLTRLLRQIVQDNLGHADERSIELRLALPPKVPKLSGDKERLSVLLNNLIGNALKYTPSGGQVVVELKTAERCVLVLVSDTGIGIAPEDQPRVFEKFYRVGSEQVLAQPGTGLGLAIAREVARMHGGDIRLQSELGVGSTFELELPIVGAPGDRT